MKARKVFTVLILATMFLVVQTSPDMFAHSRTNNIDEQADHVPSAPTGEQWELIWGGEDRDRGQAVVQVPGGGFAVAGYTQSYGAGNDDVWFVLVDDGGTVTSNQTFGTTSYDRAYDMCLVSDGGYALAGYSGLGSAADFYTVRLDAAGGLMWEFPFGTGSQEEAWSIIEDSDGYLLMAGMSYAGGADVRVTKVNATTGVEEWSYNYGGTGSQQARGIVEMVDGYAIVGMTDYNTAGSDDVWLLKIDHLGNHMWNTTFGGTETDYGFDITHGNTGGLVIAGCLQNLDGWYDYWMILTDDFGNEISNHTFGGSQNEQAQSITPTRDADGYLMVGYTSSYGEGGDDCYFVRTDNSGNLVWEMTNGTATDDRAEGVAFLTDGGFIIAGYSGPSAFTWDLWMNRLWYDTESPTFTNLPHDVFLDLNEPAYYQVQYSDHSGVRMFWLNDSNFAVTNYGYIYNVTSLGVGTYAVQVNAMDRYYNTANSWIRFTISQPTTTTTPTPTTTTTPSSTTSTTPTTNASLPPVDPELIQGLGLMLLGIGAGSGLAMWGYAKFMRGTTKTITKKEK
jgi:hypothetical protein